MIMNPNKLYLKKCGYFLQSLITTLRRKEWGRWIPRSQERSEKVKRQNITHFKKREREGKLNFLPSCWPERGINSTHTVKAADSEASREKHTHGTPPWINPCTTTAGVWLCPRPRCPGEGAWPTAILGRGQLNLRPKSSWGLASSQVSQYQNPSDPMGERTITSSESESCGQTGKRHPECCRLNNSGLNPTTSAWSSVELRAPKLVSTLVLLQACWD